MLAFCRYTSLLFILSVATVFAAASTALATTGCNAIGGYTFFDVRGCTLYYGAVDWMHAEVVVEGEAAQTLQGTGRNFYPDRPINRAEFTKLVLLSSSFKGDVASCDTDPFPDVPKETWFAPYVCAAKAKGIIDGYPDGTLKPAKQITYSEAAKILVETFGIETLSDDLTAVDGESLWYKPYVLALLREEAVAPTIKSFNHNVTRGEMAEMIYRVKH